MAGTRGGWTVHGERPVYESPWVRVRLVDVEAPEGTRFEHHVVDLRPVAVAVVVDEHDRVLLLWKYRFPAARWGYELPGGLVEDGEAPDRAAARETEEETGHRVEGEPEHLLTIEPLPGQVTAPVAVFRWRRSRPVDTPIDPHEDGVATWVDLAAVPGLVARGEVLGAATATALLLHLAAPRSGPVGGA